MKSKHQDSPAGGAPDAAPHPSRPEVLAPAGTEEALKVALQCGADSIYFGLQEGFNARARAGNFSIATLADTVARIHAAGARAYLTLNTLLFEPELPFVRDVVKAALKAGVDALIVQDPAVALLARETAPALEIHASTQMTISSPEAAVFAQDLGVTRVVLPRELSVKEIETFVAGSELETEVFIHGALCVAWSGQCLTSEAWGGRSANRGECAQSCRMPYDLVLDDAVKDLGDVRYLLSPKDLAGARAVEDLARIGVHGLKIEGRQKGPQYVASAVTAYRHWVDAVAAGRAHDPAAQKQLQADLLATSLAYTRGFGDGFLGGSDHQTLVEGRFPKHRGVYLGRVVKIGATDVEIEPDPEGRPWTGALALGDRDQGPQGQTAAPLRHPDGRPTDGSSGPEAASIDVKPGHGVVFDAGHPEDKNEPGGPVFRVAHRGGRTVLGFGTPGPDLARVKPGHRVWVTSDPAITRETDRLLKAPERQAKEGLHVEVDGSAGRPLMIRARAGHREAAVETTTPAQSARGAGLSEEVLRDKLGALGDTPFELTGIDASRLEPGLHVPVSELKAARRALVAQLLAMTAPLRAAEKPRPAPVDRPRFELDALAPADPAPHVIPLCRNDEQLEAAIAAGCAEVELDWMELTGLGIAVERARSKGLRVTVATLRVQKPGEQAIDDNLARLKPDAFLVRHWGGLVTFAGRRAGKNTRVHGDFSLNVTNSTTARHLFEWGLDTVTASHDLDESQLFAMLENVPAGRVEVVVHHRIATFHTEHCVYSHLLSGGRDFRSCGRPCEKHEVGLRDHQRRIHPVIVDTGCRNTVFNSEVQSAARLVPRLLKAGVRRYRVEFVRETRHEAAVAITAYRALLAGKTTPGDLLATLGVKAKQGVSARAMELMEH